MRRALLLVGVAMVLAGCGAPAGNEQATASDTDPGDVARALVDAHDLLVAFDTDVEADPETAADDWPDVADRIDDAVAAAEVAEDLPRQERSALVGFRRGLRVAADAYTDVAKAAASDDHDATTDALDSARPRLDALTNLRDGLPQH